jgi:hypothetical protein
MIAVMQARRRPLALLALLVVALGLAVAPATAAPRCFVETSQCIDGRFGQYWEQNGGLPVFGLPLTAEQPGQFTTQLFERNSFELHPENVAPYDVLLGRLGDTRLRQLGLDWFAFPKADPSAAHYFAQTGHAIAHEPFWRYWSTHGLELGDRGVSERESLALWGLPLSEPTVETNASGDTVLTQWFERARFEDHGAQGVLLGLLGSETVAAAPSDPGASPVPAPPSATPLPTAIPPAPTAIPPAPTARPQPTAQPQPACHPSYPDFCIPPPPPDLDCPDIGRKNFTVLPPDPHRFDADKDGVGCES